MRKLIPPIAGTVLTVAFELSVDKGWFEQVPDTVVALLWFFPALLWIYYWYTHEEVKKRSQLLYTRPMSSLLIFVAGGALLGACAGTLGWFSLRQQHEHHKPATESKGKEPVTQLTLEQLFFEDFADTMRAKLGDDGWFVTVTYGKDSLRVKAQLFIDWQRRAKFVGFYIPASTEHTYAACKVLADQIPTFIGRVEGHGNLHVQVKDPEKLRQLDGIQFTGKVYLYHESDMTIKERADLLDLYSSKNLDVDFRGPQYLLNIAIQRAQGQRP